MKVFSILCCLVVATASAQTPVSKTVAVQKGQTITLYFDYPKIVKLSTWDKNEVSVTGTVSINGGENDDAFELETDNSGNSVSVRNVIRNMKNIPHRITVIIDGKKMSFRSKGDWRRYQEEHEGVQTSMMNDGLDMEIELEVKVPQNTETRVNMVYGLVEVKNFIGPITVDATYGGVDAALTEKNVGELIAETNYGSIYSNLDMKVEKNNIREEDFHMQVNAKPGTGPRYRFESKYGNVYLRKGQ